MIEEVEECWSCKGQGFVVKKDGVKPCWGCHGEKVCTRKQNIFAKKRGNWVNVIKNVRNQVNNPITDNDGMNTIILTVKELAFVKYFFKKDCDMFFNQENLEETIHSHWDILTMKKSLLVFYHGIVKWVKICLIISRSNL